jgi:hypothetical protein
LTWQDIAGAVGAICLQPEPSQGRAPRRAVGFGAAKKSFGRAKPILPLFAPLTGLPAGPAILLWQELLKQYFKKHLRCKLDIAKHPPSPMAVHHYGRKLTPKCHIPHTEFVRRGNSF